LQKLIRPVEPAMTDAFQQHIGSYQIESQIGQGNMATVYRAFQPQLGRYVLAATWQLRY
jgi:hypothetical protein